MFSKGRRPSRCFLAKWIVVCMLTKHQHTCRGSRKFVQSILLREHCFHYFKIWDSWKGRGLRWQDPLGINLSRPTENFLLFIKNSTFKLLPGWRCEIIWNGIFYILWELALLFAWVLCVSNRTNISVKLVVFSWNFNLYYGRRHAICQVGCNFFNFICIMEEDMQSTKFSQTAVTLLQKAKARANAGPP